MFEIEFSDYTFFMLEIEFSDYTCVAVNAGGVMEENISLTFEEPKPVSVFW